MSESRQGSPFTPRRRSRPTRRSSSARRLAGFAAAVALLLLGCGGPTPPPEGATDRADRGGALYAATCQRCHGDRDGRGGAAGAPPHGPDGHTWHHPDAQLVEWVLEGRSGGAMPSFKDTLSRADVEAILTFIKGWWKDDQRATQADVSRRYQEALDAQSASP